MWKATIARTERNGNILNIIITYANGDNTFNETISTDKAQSDDWLTNQINDRLNQLNALDAFEQAIQINNPVATSYNIDLQTLTLTPISPILTPLETPQQDLGTVL